MSESVCRCGRNGTFPFVTIPARKLASVLYIIDAAINVPLNCRLGTFLYHFVSFCIIVSSYLISTLEEKSQNHLSQTLSISDFCTQNHPSTNALDSEFKSPVIHLDSSCQPHHRLRLRAQRKTPKNKSHFASVENGGLCFIVKIVRAFRWLTYA